MERLRQYQLALAIAVVSASPLSAQADHPTLRFRISVPSTTRSEPITGRVFLMLSRRGEPEPRLQAGAWETSVPFFGKDVEGLGPDQEVVIDEKTLGYPVKSLGDIPSGDYFVQALVNIYTEFPRSDGHVVWLHDDQWEGQRFNRSPGNLHSAVRELRLDPKAGYDVALSLTDVIPPVEIPPDNDWVRRIKFKSDLLSAFWGRPIYLGATVLLPQGYDDHPEVSYPVVYQQGHFSLQPPLGFRTDSTPETAEQRALRLHHNGETGFQFYRHWTSPGFPRMIGVTFQHPTPYYDDSYAVNSANNGPYGDAIIQELIPRVEREFRAIGEPYARVLTGGSTGGWESLALQIHHPAFFGGAWALCPDPIDFTRYGLINIYEDTSAFVPSFHREWIVPERYWMRDYWRFTDLIGQPTITTRDMSRFELVLGSRGRSGEQLGIWEAAYGPVGDDGYVRQLWDKATGSIDRVAADYMRDHGYDLVHHVRENWSAIGPDLVEKLHVYVGEMDQFYLNLAVYKLEEFLESAEPYYEGEIVYGRPMKGHCWRPMPAAAMLRAMADHIAASAPEGHDPDRWRY